MVDDEGNFLKQEVYNWPEASYNFRFIDNIGKVDQ